MKSYFLPAADRRKKLYHVTIYPTFGNIEGEAIGPMTFGHRGMRRDAFKQGLELAVAQQNLHLPRSSKLKLRVVDSYEAAWLGAPLSVDEVIHQLEAQHEALLESQVARDK